MHETRLKNFDRNTKEIAKLRPRSISIQLDASAILLGQTNDNIFLLSLSGIHKKNIRWSTRKLNCGIRQLREANT